MKILTKEAFKDVKVLGVIDGKYFDFQKEYTIQL
ncbi:conserved hypothetical protein ['Nostoc azollae' 0708]|uniref:Uncharacterized protein n=1 Tax=Nostoc azollae (strain 0708) TaxID=551115 RepID=D7E0S8_NOSA0|nr:conserved hypothetical protein ['Nostoc azollae' 0708]